MDRYLKHYGIPGMKWGERNGPPYPLDYNSKSTSERRKEKVYSDGQNLETERSNNRREWKLTDKQKKILKIGTATAVAGLAIYGGYKLDKLHLKNNLSKSALNCIKSEEELEAVSYYTQMYYRSINSILRTGSYGDEDDPLAKVLSSEARKRIPLITSVIDRSRTSRNMTVSRRVNSVSSMFGVSDEELYDLISNGKFKGMKFTDKGFCSTSTFKGKNVSTMFGDTVLHIFVPKGSKGIFLGGNTNISSNSHESELLLQRGSSFVVKNYKLTNGVITDVFLDLVGQEY